VISKAIGKAIRCDKFAHQPIVSIPAHSPWLVRICIGIRIAAEPPANLARPPVGSITQCFALRSVGETICDAGPKVSATKGKI
jgi:hypothetical protein